MYRFQAGFGADAYGKHHTRRQQLAAAPDFEPLLSRSPQHSLTDRPLILERQATAVSPKKKNSGSVYHSLQPMKIHPRISLEGANSDVDENESKPLLRLSSSSTLGDAQNLAQATAIQIHLPEMKTAKPLQSRNGARDRITRGLGVVQDSNPAKELAGICSHGFCCIQCIRTSEVGVLQTFGQVS